MKTWHRSRSFSESCRHAWDGVLYVLLVEANIRRQLIGGAAVFLLAMIFSGVLKIPLSHLLAVLVISAVVVVVEFINTAIEVLENVVHPEYHESIKHSKDIMAGAVMVASLAAVIIGVLVFVPPLVRIVG